MHAPLSGTTERGTLQDLGWWRDRHDPDLGPRLLAALEETFLVKSQRVALNRRMNLLRSARAFNKTWRSRLVAYLHLATLEGSKLGKAMPLKRVMGQASSTSAPRPAVAAFAWQTAFLEQGFLARQKGTSQWILSLGPHWGRCVLALPVLSLALGASAFFM